MVKMIPNGTRYQGGPSDAEMQRRYDAASETMKANGIDLILTSTCDALQCQYVRWFIKIRRGVFSVVMFDKDKNLSFFGHGGEGLTALPPFYGLKLETNTCVPVWHNNCIGDHLLSDKIIKIAKEKGCKKIGILSMNQFPSGTYVNLVKGLPGVEIVDATDIFDQLISVKSEEELKFHLEAVEFHERFADALPALVYAGRTERELGMDLYRLSCLAGSCEYLSNIGMGATKLGSQTAPLQYQNKIIEEGDTINILFEVPSQAGYYADFRRLFAVGSAAPEVVEAMAASKEAQLYMASLCKPGVTGKEIFEVMNEYFVKIKIPQETRMHGHGQGYGLVERPFFDAREPMVLKENMFLSLHPQMRMNGVQFAISSNFIVKSDGAKLLNRYPHEVTIV